MAQHAAGNEHLRSSMRSGSVSPRSTSPSSNVRKTSASMLRTASVGRASGRSINGGHLHSLQLHTESGSAAAAFNGANGCLCSPLTTTSVTSPNASCHACRGNVLESAFGCETAETPFLHAQQEVYAMVLRLDDVVTKTSQRPTVDTTVVDGDKFSLAREALVSESRQFVTASKLFVRSATECSPQTVEHLATCVALLDRMFTASERLVLSGGSSWVSLLDQVKAVALAYTRAVSTAGKSAHTASGGGTVGSLMHQATDLASALTTLMRTLRSFDNS